MRGVENNATRKYNGKRTTSNKKKIQGPKIFFCCFNFCSFFLFQKSCNFIYILYFFLLICKRGTK